MATPSSLMSWSWVILSRETHATFLSEDVDLTLTFAAPSGVSVLRVSPRISPVVVHPSEKCKSAAVLAIDPSAGLVLLFSPLLPPYPGDCEDGVIPHFFVCDFVTPIGSHVYDPEGLVINNNELGVIAVPGGCQDCIARPGCIVGQAT
uniref:DUF1618 domain-containing protein n=1 Tax=Oryza brachyantha TaxID=4533 RepID=J3KY52_ORYBR